MGQKLIRRFPLPLAAVPAAESWRSFGSRRPLHAREAASLILLRDGAEGPEVLLKHRVEDSPLGRISFPGGVCEDDDADSLGWYGRPIQEWANQLGETDYGRVRRFVVAAIRHLFVETGYLLAGPDEFSLAEDLHGEEAMRARLALANEEKTLAQLLNRRGWGVRSDLLRPIGSWSTPDFAHRRFNTHYFVAAAPAGQSHLVLEGSRSWLGWVNVAEMVETQHTSWLGDLPGAPDTAGLSLPQLTTPAVQLFCEALNRFSGSVAFLLNVSPRTKVPHLQAQLNDDDEHDELVLEYSPEAQQSIWAGGQRQRPPRTLAP